MRAFRTFKCAIGQISAEKLRLLGAHAHLVSGVRLSGPLRVRVRVRVEDISAKTQAISEILH